MNFIANFIRFTAVQKFWRSVKIWQSYREFNNGNFFWDTVYIILLYTSKQAEMPFCRSVFENAYFTFTQISKTWLTFFLNDVSKSRKKSGFIVNISKQRAFETKKIGWIMTLTLLHRPKCIKFAETMSIEILASQFPGYGDL